MTVKWPSNAVPEDAYRVGARPIPTTDAELNNLVAEIFERELAKGDFTLDTSAKDASARDRFSARFGTHPEIERIAVDFTGAVAKLEENHLQASAQEQPAGAQPAEHQTTAADASRPTVATRAETALRSGSVTAHPLYVESMPVSIDLRGKNLALDWLTDTEGTLWLNTPDRKIPGFEGSAELQLNLDDAESALRSMVGRMAKQEAAPVRIKDVGFDLDVARPLLGEQVFTLNGTVAGRYRFFGAKITARLVGTLQNATATVILQEAHFSSTNPLVHLAFIVFRKKLRENLHKPIALVKGLPEGYRAENFEVITRGRNVSAKVNIV